MTKPRISKISKGWLCCIGIYGWIGSTPLIAYQAAVEAEKFRLARTYP